MRFLAKQIFVEPRHGLLRHSVVAALIAFLGAALMVTAFYGIACALGNPPDPNAAPEVPITAFQFFAMVVFAPVVGTILLAFTITALATFLRSKLWISVFAALVFGGAHSLTSRFWFFAAVWPFFIFSCCYLIWRARSLTHALAAAAIPHALINISVFVVAALSASA